jgi:hypothetical protein
MNAHALGKLNKFTLGSEGKLVQCTLVRLKYLINYSTTGYDLIDLKVIKPRSWCNYVRGSFNCQ